MRIKFTLQNKSNTTTYTQTNEFAPFLSVSPLDQLFSPEEMDRMLIWICFPWTKQMKYEFGFVLPGQTNRGPIQTNERTISWNEYNEPQNESRPLKVTINKKLIQPSPITRHFVS